MRFPLSLCVASCLLPTGLLAQWLETTIELPDTSSPIALCYNPVSNRVYCAAWGNATVCVIDGATNQITATVAVPTWPNGLCCNTQNNKVYCTDWEGVTVIDSLGDTVTITLPGLGDAAGLCYNPQENKVYCGFSGQKVAVIDGAADSVVATVDFDCGVLCCNRLDNRMYATGEWNYGVAVVNCATNLVLDTVPTGMWTVALCHNLRNDKVYCADAYSDTVTVFDGATNRIVAAINVGGSPNALCYDSCNNKVYCANYSSNDVTVIDGATDSVLCTISVGAGPSVLCHNPRQNRVYVANHLDGTISVLRDSGGGVEDGPKPQASSSKSAATVVRGVLTMPLGKPGQSTTGQSLVFLLDIAGRKVLELQPGPNDVSRLAPGVHFVRCERSAVSGEPSAVRKVVIAR